jgi:CheY-like chemotaxis protein
VSPPYVILVAEDNEDDLVLLRCALKSAGLPHKLIRVADGIEAVDYLYANEPFTNRSTSPFPDLLLLDLQMPVMDGFAVLAALKGRPQFRSLPIVVLSSVDDPLFIQQALNSGATDFVIKPVTTDDRIEMLRRLHSRWLATETKPAIGRIPHPWAVPPPGQESRKSR